MPMWCRTPINCASFMVSTRCPSTQIVPESGFNRPSISFRIVDLPAPLAPRKILVCPARTSKRHVAQNHLLVERQVDLVEQHHRRVRLGELDRQSEVGDGLGAHQNRIEINNRVTKKSTISTTTDAATTALVVERPTPWVPPVVRRPT